MTASPFNTARYLSIPADFEISVYTRINTARFMAITPDGNLLVSVPGEGKVKLVKSVTSGDPVVSDFVSGLNQPHDMVFHVINDTTYLYISEQNQINRYVYHTGDATGKNRKVIIFNLPDASLPELKGAYAHALKNIALDPNHHLYVSIASSCNACVEDTKSDPVRGAVYIYNADGTNGRLFARGIRNAEGLAFLPGTNTLWAVVNNRDNMVYPYNDNTGNYGKTITSFVDNNPPDEFIRVGDGNDFGWPFCNPDPRQGLDNMPFIQDYDLNKDGSVSDCSKMTRVQKGIQAHSAALGLLFLQNTAFPSQYRKAALVGLHGSWNRAVKTGYKVVYFPWDTTSQAPLTQIDLVRGFLNSDSSQVFGRPVDIAVSPQGDLFISDDYSGTIYKLKYIGFPTALDEFNVPLKNSITVYPQPAMKTMQIKLVYDVAGDIRLSLTSLQGKEIIAFSQTVTQGETILQLPAETIAPGIYILSIRKGEQNNTQRVVIE
jgi:glucose/arabinose dehydrogenase